MLSTKISGLLFATVVIASCQQTSGTKSGNETAGHEVGNGGDVIICQQLYPAMANKRVMLLDNYEARTARGLLPDLSGAAGLDAKISLLLQRLSLRDPNRSTIYLTYAEAFISETAFLPNAHLPDIPDDGPISLPGRDCELRQIAVQKEPEIPGDLRYNIDQELWDLLDEDERAGLVFHEISYREAKFHEHVTSSKIRYLNGLLASNALEQTSNNEYVNLLENIIKLPAIRTVGGIKLKMRGLEFDQLLQVSRGESLENPLQWKNQTYNLIEADQFIAFDQKRSVTMSLARFPITQYPNGGPIPSSHMADACGGISIVTETKLTFSPNGTLESAEDLHPELNTTDRWISVTVCDQNNLPSSSDLVIKEPTRLTFTSGNIPNEEITFGLFDHYWRATAGWALNFKREKIEMYPSQTVNFSASGLTDIEIPTFDLAIGRPIGTDNRTSGDETYGLLRLESTDAQDVFSRMASLDTKVDPDGETRFYATRRHGFSLVCKHWMPENIFSCEMKLSSSAETEYHYDGTQWIFSLKTAKYEGDTDRKLSIASFNFDLTGSEDSCQEFHGPSFTISSMSLCKAHYGDYKVLSARITKIP